MHTVLDKEMMTKKLTTWDTKVLFCFAITPAVINWITEVYALAKCEDTVW